MAANSANHKQGKSLFWVNFFTLGALITLIGLGSWQVYRLNWKGQLIENLQSRAGLTPIEMPLKIIQQDWQITQDEWEFRPVTVTGEFLHDSEFHVLARSLNGNEGFHIYTPLRLNNADGAVMLINRGWVPFDMKERATRPQNLPQGPVTINGIIRYDKGISALQAFALPDDEIDKNLWYVLDGAQKSSVFGGQLPKAYIAVDKELPDISETYPVTRQWYMNIPNNHLQYALTWYGLAIGLIAVYIVFRRQHFKDKS